MSEVVRSLKQKLDFIKYLLIDKPQRRRKKSAFPSEGEIDLTSKMYRLQRSRSAPVVLTKLK